MNDLDYTKSPRLLLFEEREVDKLVLTQRLFLILPASSMFWGSLEKWKLWSNPAYQNIKLLSQKDAFRNIIDTYRHIWLQNDFVGRFTKQFWGKIVYSSIQSLWFFDPSGFATISRLPEWNHQQWINSSLKRLSNETIIILEGIKREVFGSYDHILFILK